MGPARPSAPLLVGAIVLAILSVSTSSPLILESRAPAVVIALHRLGFATLILAAVAAARPSEREALAALSRRDLLGLSAVGVVLAIHFWSWIESLSHTSVASSVVIVTIHPVLVAIISRRLYGEGFARTAWAGVFLAVAGGALIAFSDAGLDGNQLYGDFLALVGAAAVALYFLAGRGYRRRLSLLSYVVPVYAGATLTLLLLALALDLPITGWPGREYALFLGMAVGPMILGHTLLNWALRYVTAPVIATTVLGEPVGSTLLVWFLQGQVPPAGSVIGGAIVLGGIFLVALAQARTQRRPVPIAGA